MLTLPSFTDAVIIDWFAVIDMFFLAEWKTTFCDESWRRFSSVLCSDSGAEKKVAVVTD